MRIGELLDADDGLFRVTIGRAAWALVVLAGALVPIAYGFVLKPYQRARIDAIIAQITAAPPDGDDLLLRRLKKRKLLLKDRIAIIQHLMEPDEPA